MTPGIVRALARAEAVSLHGLADLQQPEEPTLTEPKAGNPISHAQLIGLSKLLKKHASQLSENTTITTHESSTARDDSHDQNDTSNTNDSTANTTTTHPTPATLSALLHGTQIYTPPPPPPPAKSPQYKALMSRLRAEEEARTYELMLHPPPTRETFNQRFPSAPAFSLGASAPADDPDSDLAYEEVHRQIILIINILISIVCVAVFIWIAARHWSVGKRLGMSMAGSIGIAVAEVAVYGGYVRKVKEAKQRERKKPEIKEIVRSWVLHKGSVEEEEEEENVKASGRDEGDVRRRKGKHR